MIKYALLCDQDHEFEAWFSNSASYDDQVARKLVECPHCGSLDVRKALMAPAVRTSRKREASPEEQVKQMASKVRAHIRDNYDYVGDEFASEARAMHEGEKPERLIYGETSAEESKALTDEGVPVTPLPDAFAPTPPKKVN
ncbi:MAG: DUF1178 family protein [Maricaulis sp.]|uniref:DUF1178 family protein n=1 Tax=Maricaulis sp. TaxID=1486257 RepID=UPI001B158B33|nr:DUF1178 family protein [Maricaulis sp.]MBO6729262.1 DUF1178 family protein [Maricaulis sp.]MBO6847987.1 DUF1178 family protein [Maricaulis sp.]MBO6877635.1 DUF1178 family protein [Maricaulis sp.]